MGRTRLRGIELAGIRLAVEAPPSFRWEWPDGELSALACAPTASDVYVGVSVGRAEVSDWDPITYAFAGGTFDVGRRGDDWQVIVHGRRQRCERVARFDAEFKQGEVIVSPTAACTHPLDQPLLDIVLLHRIIGKGGLVAAGSAVLRDGRALAFVGPGAAAPGAAQDRVGWRKVGAPLSVRTRGGRFALLPWDDTLRAHGLPGGGGQISAGVSARLDAIHVIARSRAVYAEPLARDSAAGELLQYVYAPVHDPRCVERLMGIANNVAALVPVLKLGLPEENRVIPFTWGQRQAALAFAPPFVG